MTLGVEFSDLHKINFILARSSFVHLSCLFISVLFYKRIKNGHEKFITQKSLIAQKFSPLKFNQPSQFQKECKLQRIFCYWWQNIIKNFGNTLGTEQKISPVRSFNCSFKYFSFLHCTRNWKFFVPINWMRWIERKFNFYTSKVKFLRIRDLSGDFALFNHMVLLMSAIEWTNCRKLMDFREVET